ncbi:nuclear transport factor 2 family protein [Arthrobacter sp. TWP1-1]|uniref:nuclear transport factor 2 family protein n=1 Tax=Arthrobacter sp. TWP1-1 TaxID=2804568 RepID=UPI003CECF1EF
MFTFSGCAKEPNWPSTTSPDANFPATAGEIRAVFEDECEAMVRGDSDALNELLTYEFTLTHMTGYVQPKDEWMDDVRTHQMQYHSMGQVDLVADLDAGAPVLTARTITDATIWGGRGTWQLQLRSWFENIDGEWLISRTVASVW